MGGDGLGYHLLGGYTIYIQDPTLNIRQTWRGEGGCSSKHIRQLELNVFRKKADVKNFFGVSKLLILCDKSWLNILITFRKQL